jgi:transposase
MKIRVELSKTQMRELEKMMRATKSRIEAERCRIILLLAQGDSPGQVQSKAGCVRSTVYTTLYRFEEEGLDGLLDKRLHRPPRKATAEVRAQLLSYLDCTPQDLGWQRTTWTLELLKVQLQEDTGIELSESHLGSVLRQEKCRRGRPRPALRIPVHGRRKILENIEELVNKACPGEEVFYLDEADIDLNPRIGLTCIKQGQQPLILTPGKNVKYYMAGALDARTGSVVYSHGPRKNSELFVNALDVPRQAYRRAKTIHVMLNNYVIHKSRYTPNALETMRGRIQLHFLPPYSPEHNPMERLWKQLQDNATRNHRHKTMPELWRHVVRFLEDAQPFPGTKVSLPGKVA